MFTYLCVAFGSALGGIARYYCTTIADRYFVNQFPWGTLFVNIIGSFIIGFCAALSFSHNKSFFSAHMQKFIIVGFCGGYTTFSSFSLETFKFIEQQEFLKAFSNISCSFILCLAATFLGYMLATQLNQTR
ncbi:MAG: fluoride efflux transporter CrcB [Silvanigrellaceae bacterium]|nr:fluoride efflux transporter CrcB [Silvanigrellaceae bacterium]